jgi:cyclopropane-fatty-acyl-phospholipid synthase
MKMHHPINTTRINNLSLPTKEISRAALAPALRAAFRNLIRIGHLEIIDSDGNLHAFGDEDKNFVRIKISGSSAYWKLLLNPGLYLGELYMDGDLQIEKGSLYDFLSLVFINLSSKNKTTWFHTAESLNFDFSPLRHINTISRSFLNVSHHYDLSPELYDLFLDPERQYSCAYFSSTPMTLEQAQKNKMKHITTKLLIEPQHHVLDIGCGWGGLACFIARHTGARVTGITLSSEQLVFARRKAQEQNLSDRVKYKLCDYRKLKGTFERIVSVGMFEHVGLGQYPAFFKTLQALLTPDGVALLHSIGRSGRPIATNAWIRKYIFPGGYIPAVSQVLPHIEKNGLILTDLEILRLHYAQTLLAWRQEFTRNRQQIKNVYDERFCRMWEFYLASSEASFRHLGNMVFQMQLTKNFATAPITRNYLYH